MEILIEVMENVFKSLVALYNSMYVVLFMHLLSKNSSPVYGMDTKTNVTISKKSTGLR